jgi:hypothetical protein
MLFAMTFLRLLSFFAANRLVARVWLRSAALALFEATAWASCLVAAGAIAASFSASVVHTSPVLNKSFTRSVLAALSLFCASCASGPAELMITGKVTVKVDPSVRPTRATAGVANEVTVILPAETPGYQWQIAQHNSNTLRQLTEIVPVPDSPGEAMISFLTLRNGLTRVMFTLVPTAEGPVVTPADLQEIELIID